MEYLQITLNINNSEDYISEILPTFLGEIGFDSFEITDQSINAYCPKSLFSETGMINVLHNLPCCIDDITYTIEEIEDINWNATWETESFKPVEINERCCVRPSNINVEKDYEYDIIINPTQSFGTGYHETTRMVMNAMFDNSPTHLNVLDMGCGTAVLSILASKLGAKHIVAIDIDQWSYNNAKDNISLNNVTNIDVHLGDADTLKPIEHKYSIVLANINRNILLNDMHKYVAVMENDALLIMSGFLTEDYPIIHAKATELGLTAQEQYTDNGWQAATFKK